MAKRPKYKDKETLESGNTLYHYTKGQIAHRNREKADRLEALRRRVKSLRSRYRQDMSSRDAKTAQVATAVAIMDHTGSRVGNPASASEGHFGVTQLLGRHVRRKGSGLSLEYVGKSGVRQTKRISDSKLAGAILRLKSGDNERVLPLATSTSVNAYLRPFQVTAKDLRGLKANETMRKELSRKRNTGRKLPRLLKERKPVLRAEFKGALERTARKIGHEPATLRRQYLVPNLEKSFMKDGTIPRQMNPPPDSVTYEVPQSVRKAAQRGLDLRRKQRRGNKAGLTPKEAGRLGIGSGVARARDLVKGRVSYQTVKRMKAYFARHDSNVDLDPGKTPTEDKGYVAGLLWGGRQGERWAKSVISQADRSNPPSDPKTPALPEERIKGSRVNKTGSAASARNRIKLGAATTETLKKKAAAHNKAYAQSSGKRVTVPMLKAVWRRGAGAFSTSHRPGMTRSQWANARVNHFLALVASGKPKNAAYVQDNDLLPQAHPKSTRRSRNMPLHRNPAPKVDLDLPTNKRVVLRADDPNPRGLIVVSRGNGRYDMQYWYGDPSKIYRAEVLVDGKVVRKLGRTVSIGFHSPDQKY